MTDKLMSCCSPQLAGINQPLRPSMFGPGPGEAGATQTGEATTTKTAAGTTTTTTEAPAGPVSPSPAIPATT